MAESRIRSGKQTEIRGDISNETNVKHVRKNKDSRRQVSIPSYTGLGFMVHLLLLIIYIAVHIHGAIIFMNYPDPEKHFRGSCGGPWKYLTYINLVCVAVPLIFPLLPSSLSPSLSLYLTDPFPRSLPPPILPYFLPPPSRFLFPLLPSLSSPLSLLKFLYSSPISSLSPSPISSLSPSLVGGYHLLSIITLW